MSVCSHHRSIVCLSSLESHKTDEAKEAEPTPILAVASVIIHGVDSRRHLTWLLSRNPQTEPSGERENPRQTG
jgi:hypothetical protein